MTFNALLITSAKRNAEYWQPSAKSVSKAFDELGNADKSGCYAAYLTEQGGSVSPVIQRFVGAEIRLGKDVVEPRLASAPYRPCIRKRIFDPTLHRHSPPHIPRTIVLRDWCPPGRDAQGLPGLLIPRLRADGHGGGPMRIPIVSAATAVLLLLGGARAVLANDWHYEQPFVYEHLNDRNLRFSVESKWVPRGYLLRFDRRAEMIRILRTSDDPATRIAMVKRLVLYKEQRVLDCMLQTLGDPDMNVRERVIWALGELGFKKAIKPLIEAFGYNPRHVRLTIAHVLTKLTGEDFGLSRARVEGLVRAQSQALPLSSLQRASTWEWVAESSPELSMIQSARSRFSSSDIWLATRLRASSSSKPLRARSRSRTTSCRAQTTITPSSSASIPPS